MGGDAATSCATAGRLKTAALSSPACCVAGESMCCPMASQTPGATCGRRRRQQRQQQRRSSSGRAAPSCPSSRCCWSTTSGSWCRRRFSTPQVGRCGGWVLGVRGVCRGGPGSDGQTMSVQRTVPTAARQHRLHLVCKPDGCSPPLQPASQSPIHPASLPPIPPLPSCRHWHGGGWDCRGDSGGGAGSAPPPARPAVVQRAAHRWVGLAGGAGLGSAEAAPLHVRVWHSSVHHAWAARLCPHSSHVKPPPHLHTWHAAPRPFLPQAARRAAPASESGCMRSCGRWCPMTTRWGTGLDPAGEAIGQCAAT